MTYIAIVDDNKGIRDTLGDRLRRFSDCQVLFTAENGEEFLCAMKDTSRMIKPDVVLVDLDMPVMNGIRAIEEAKLRFSGTKFLVLTIFDEDEKIFRAIKAGADGYLLKDEPVEKIWEAIQNVRIGEGAPMSPGIARKVLNLLSHKDRVVNPQDAKAVETDYNLTEREKEILNLLVDGLEYKEIAVQLGLSPNTVRNNVTRIYSKLHVTSRMQAARVVSGKSGFNR